MGIVGGNTTFEYWKKLTDAFNYTLPSMLKLFVILFTMKLHARNDFFNQLKIRMIKILLQ